MTLAGHLPVEREVTLRGGERLALKLDLVSRNAPGQIALQAGCKGAAVKLDGASVGSIPLTSPIEAVAGRHEVEVRCRDHAPFFASVDVTAGAEVTIAVRQEPMVRIASDGVSRSEVEDRLIPTSAWIAGGVGVAGLVTGGIFYWLATQAAQDAETPADREKYDERQQQADRDVVLSNASLVVGTAALGTAGVLIWLHQRQSGAEKDATVPTAAIVPQDGGVAGVLRMQF